MAVLALGLAILVAISLGVFLSNRPEGSAKPGTEALASYTQEIANLSQFVQPAAEQMAAQPDGSFAGLEADSRRWLDTFNQGLQRVGQMTPPDGLATANQLLAQSMELYISSADTFQLVPKAGEAIQADIVSRAVDQRNQAMALFGVALRLVDEKRTAADLPPAGIPIPGQTGLQTPEPSSSPSAGAPTGGSGKGGKSKPNGESNKENG